MHYRAFILPERKDTVSRNHETICGVYFEGVRNLSLFYDRKPNNLFFRMIINSSDFLIQTDWARIPA